ncbi:hypothetical protein KIPB_008348, partial [Kipferlia bialata]
GLDLRHGDLLRSRPHPCHDCIPLGDGRVMVVGQKNDGDYLETDLPSAFIMSLRSDKYHCMGDTNHRGTVCRPIPCPGEGETRGVCLGGKVYLYAGGQRRKGDREELSTAEDSEVGGRFEDYCGISLPRPDPCTKPCLHVYALDSGVWESGTLCGEEGPHVRYPRGMVAVSDTKFLLVAGKNSLGPEKPLQTWLYDTEERKWERLSDVPIMHVEDERPTDTGHSRWTFGMDMVGGVVHLVGCSMVEGGVCGDTFYVTYTLPTEAYPKGVWSPVPAPEETGAGIQG